jgi:hypothetical protein
MTALTTVKLSQVIPSGATRVQLELTQMPTRELSEVRLGRTFVFGLLEDNLSWCLIRMSSIRSINFLQDQSRAQSPVHWTRKTAGEFLASLDLPACGILRYRDDPSLTQQLVVVAATKGLIATDSYQQPYIPLAAISYLELKAC